MVLFSFHKLKLYLIDLFGLIDIAVIAPLAHLLKGR